MSEKTCQSLTVVSARKEASSGEMDWALMTNSSRNTRSSFPPPFKVCCHDDDDHEVTMQVNDAAES